MCTSIVLKAKDGSVVQGRTNEFGSYYKNELLLFPRNYEYPNTVFGKEKKFFKNKYAHIGANCGVVLGEHFHGDNIIQDSINEKGLSMSLHYYPQYASYKMVDEVSIDEIDFITLAHHIMSQCSSIDEVIDLVEKTKDSVVFPKSFYAPGHFFIVDNTGRNIAIEPNGPDDLNIVEGNGVFTNSPNYEFHLKNLNSYSNVQVYDMNQKSVLGDNINSFGVSGGFGVPFDTSPPSRFVRATYLKNTTTKSTLLNVDDVVLRMQRLLNSFDILPGQALKKTGGDILGEAPKELDNNSVETDFNNTASGHTDHTLLKDLSRIRYYYKDWKNQNWRYVEMSDYDLDTSEILRVKMIDDNVETATKVKMK